MRCIYTHLHNSEKKHMIDLYRYVQRIQPWNSHFVGVWVHKNKTKQNHNRVNLFSECANSDSIPVCAALLTHVSDDSSNLFFITPNWRS